MKRKLLMAAFALLLGWGNASATDWVGNEPAAGTFYLYNVGADRFLGYGANWGTRATVEHAGIPVTLTNVSDGVYKIITNVVENDRGLIAEGYVDGTSADWTFTNVSGNIYQISNGSNYLYWNKDDKNSATNVDTSLPSPIENSYWKLVTTDERDAAFTAMNATESVPLDITYKFIENPNTTYFTNIYSTNMPWGGSSWTLGGYQNWQDAKDYCGERYNTTFDSYITIEDIPNGEYEFGVQGFYRDGNGSAAITNFHSGSFHPNAKIYANSNTTDMQSIACHSNTTKYNDTDSEGTYSETTYYVPNNQYMAEVYTYKGLYPWQSVKTIVTDGTLRIGVKKETTISADWTIVDKFYLSYLGPTIAAKATALPGGNMTVDTWYYFNIPADGEYDLTLSTLADIVYTKDNTILYENESGVTDNFAGTDAITLTAGRYFVKSSSVQTLSVAPHSYAYNVGDATLSTSDGGYTQSSTFTVTFPSASTSDPGASPALVASSTATVNGNTVDLSAVTNGFSLDLGSLTAGTDYAISIPADVYGYAGKSMNTSISLTIHTPAIFDGTYFIKTSGNQYLSRGGSYNTQAIVDDKGLPVRVSTNSSNVTEFIFIDNWFHLFDAGNGNLYTDNNTANNFEVEATTGGYYIINKNTVATSTYNGKMYYDSSDGNRVKASTTNSTVWTFEAPAAHKTQMQAVKDAQASAVATTAGISATTVDGLSSILESDFVGTDISITGTGGTISESYQEGASNVTGNELQIFEETKSGLTPGLYCLTVTAFERITWPNDVYNYAKGAPGLTYVYANDQKVQLWSLFDFPSNSKWDDGDKVYDGKYYADNTAGADAAFAADNYVNKVFVYVTDEGDGTGSIHFGINKPHRYGNDGSRGAWICYNNFTLTYYGAVTATIGSTGWTTFASEYALDLSGITASEETVTAYYASEAGAESVTLTSTEQDAVQAGEGIMLKGKAGATITIPVVASGTAITGNMLVGCTTDTHVYGSANYILYNDGGTGKFMDLANYDSESPLTIPAGKAYLHVGGGSSKSLRIVVGGNASNVDAPEVADVEEPEVLYNMAGVQVDKNFKGFVVNQKGEKRFNK